MLAEKKLCSCHFIKYYYKLAGRHYLKLSCNEVYASKGEVSEVVMILTTYSIKKSFELLVALKIFSENLTDLKVTFNKFT